MRFPRMTHVAVASDQRHSIVRSLLVGLILSLSSIGAVTQTEPPSSSVPLSPESVNKYPGLLPEFSRLIDRLQHDVTFPPERTDSRLLPLLPSSTIAYMGLPNYGGVARQALTIFQQELNSSPDLRAWWADSGMAKHDSEIEDAIDRFSKVSEYVGDEIVVSGELNGREQPDLLIVAEVRKPGLKPLLQNVVVPLADKSKPGARILDPQELGTATDIHPQGLFILVRRDFVIASSNLSRLRSFNLQLDRSNHDFASSHFAQRILQSYVGGVSWVGGLDLQRIVAQIPKDPGLATLQRTGFADVKYAVWEHRQNSGHSISRAELSFTGPRHGMAAWLAAPQPMGSLDFVSPKAIFAASFILENPAQIFDEIKQLSASNPNALASLRQMEAAFGISLQYDVLAQLSGEVTLELDSAAPQPVWKAILGVKDANRLEQTLRTMLIRAGVPTQEYSDAGLMYHVLHVPSAQGTNATAYTFVDGYLAIASSPNAMAAAIQLHKNGESLAKSRRFLDSLPAGHTSASAILYEEPAALMTLQMQRQSPATAQSMAQLLGKSDPVVLCAYGEPDAIVEASSNPGVDAGVVLVAAAIAIPNLLRARTAANEASAVGRLRTADTAEVTYEFTYPNRGFAPDLATLGPDPSNPNKLSSTHAGLLDSTLGNPACTGTNWCTASGYRFIVRGSCTAGRCRDFIALATPETSSSGTRNFCSTSDGLIRYQVAPPLSTPLTPRDCKAWAPIR